MQERLVICESHSEDVLICVSHSGTQEHLVICVSHSGMQELSILYPLWHASARAV